MVGFIAYAFQVPDFPDYPKMGIWPTDANFLPPPCKA